MDFTQRIAAAVAAATEKALARLAEVERSVDAAIEQAISAAEARITAAVDQFQARIGDKLETLTARIEAVAVQAVEKAITSALEAVPATPAAETGDASPNLGEASNASGKLPEAFEPEREPVLAGEPSLNGQHTEAPRRGRRRS